MKQSLRMLIGRQFTVGNEIFTVCEVTRVGHRDLIEATGADRAAKPGRRIRFPVERVLQSLLVEEEIELSQPGFFGA